MFGKRGLRLGAFIERVAQLLGACLAEDWWVFMQYYDESRKVLLEQQKPAEPAIGAALQPGVPQAKSAIGTPPSIVTVSAT